MPMGREGLFMKKSTLFTTEVYFYASEIQIKPQPYPLSHNRSTGYLGLRIMSPLSHSRNSLDSPPRTPS